MKQSRFISQKARITGNSKLTVLENRQYYVFPVSILVEGVHHGDGGFGPILYRKRQLDKYSPAWNMKPVVRNHPQQGNEYVSAADPEILDEFQVGFLLRTRMKKGKQGKKDRYGIWRNMAEMWLEKDRAELIIPDELAILRSGGKIEVSTGLWSTVKGPAGVWNGEKYDGEATEFRPDHLAILTDVEGACSIRDGCGAGGTFNKRGRRMRKKRKLSISNCSCKEKTMKKGLKNRKGKKKLSSLQAKKKKLVLALSKLEEFEDEKDWLMEQETDMLEKLMKLNERVEDEDDEEDAELDDDLGDEEEDPQDDDDKESSSKKKALANKKKAAAVRKKLDAILGNKKPKDREAEVESFLKKAPAEIRDVLIQGLSAAKNNRKRLVDIIVSNESNTFEKSELRSMQTPMLEKLAALAVQETSDDGEISDYNYLGNAGVLQGSDEDEIEPLMMPEDPIVAMASKKKNRRDDDDEDDDE